MCLQNLLKFNQSFFKILRKQNITDGQKDEWMVGRKVGRSDKVKTEYPSTTHVQFEGCIINVYLVQKETQCFYLQFWG